MKQFLIGTAFALSSANVFAVCSVKFDGEGYFRHEISSTLKKDKVFVVTAANVASQSEDVKKAIADVLDVETTKAKELAAAINQADDNEVVVELMSEVLNNKKLNYIFVHGYGGDNSFGEAYLLPSFKTAWVLSDDDIMDCYKLSHADTKLNFTLEDDSSTALKKTITQKNAFEIIDIARDLEYGDIGIKKVCYEGTTSGVVNTLYTALKSAELLTGLGSLSVPTDENGEVLDSLLEVEVLRKAVGINFKYQPADEIGMKLDVLIEKCK